MTNYVVLEASQSDLDVTSSISSSRVLGPVIMHVSVADTDPVWLHRGTQHIIAAVNAAQQTDAYIHIHAPSGL